MRPKFHCLFLYINCVSYSRQCDALWLWSPYEVVLCWYCCRVNQFSCQIHHSHNVFCNVCDVFQVAVCNLASIAVNMFVRPDQTYDFIRLKDVTKIVTRNLNKIIDVNYYPIPEVVPEVKCTRPEKLSVTLSGKCYSSQLLVFYMLQN